jgi:hypothetical protein
MGLGTWDPYLMIIINLCFISIIKPEQSKRPDPKGWLPPKLQNPKGWFNHPIFVGKKKVETVTDKNGI